ncbi:amidohydrolase [Flavobacterium sp.]|uniref:amidohydrolase n=1 Tax=Flavobacterium sp. TaxID=239 RepID=UPI002608D84A|nr:amidohydrolase [Flavobacterium sp.]
MKIAIVQSESIWENPSANRTLFDEKFNTILPETDLIVLPEMFTTGFTMQPQFCAESMDGPTVVWMQSWAKKLHAALIGSIAVEDNGHFYNRLFFVHPDGKLEIYNKRHRFTLAGEHQVYTAGKERLIVTYKGWKICPLICYDLRFPAYSRNTENYDILLYVANWPQPRIQAWDLLLRARAVENMCYTLGVNRVGQDGNNHCYVGHSQAIDCFGNYSLAPQQNDAIYYVELNKKTLEENRKKFPFLEDRDTIHWD